MTGNDPRSGDEIRSLRLHKRLHDQAFRLTGMGAWECDLATDQLIWTDGIYELFGLPVGSPLKRSRIVDLYVGQSRHDMEFMRAEAIRTGEPFTLDALIRTFRGERRWIRLAADIAFEQERPIRIFGSKQDITREKEAWSRLRQVAERDPLTGLANRGMFDARYREVIGDEFNHAFVSALVLIDLDHFKQINDGLGHAAGDECLRQVAMRLSRVFNDAVQVARIGGDEFAVLLRAPLGPSRITDTLQRASYAMRRPVLWNDLRIDITGSIGARILGRPRNRKLSELFAEADAALYTAKAAGRNTIHIFGDDLPRDGSSIDLDPSSRRSRSVGR